MTEDEERTSLIDALERAEQARKASGATILGGPGEDYNHAFASRRSYLYIDADQRQVRSALIACKAAAKMRNELMHLPIFGDRSGRGRAYQRLRSGRMDRITSSPIYRLANHVSDLWGGVYGMTFVLRHIYSRPDFPDPLP
jgi:hypothetical protein